MLTFAVTAQLAFIRTGMPAIEQGESVAGLPALHGRVYQNESNNRQYNEDGDHLTTSF